MSGPPSKLALFAFTWGLATLVHLAYGGDLLRPGVHTVACLFAVAVLLRPTSAPRLLALAASQVAVLGVEMPYVSNHWLLVGIGNLALVVGLGPIVARRPADRVAAERRFAQLAPTLRAQILLLYAFATLAKVNAGFFDPEWSCGAEHYRNLAARVPLLPDAPWTAHAAIAGTLLVEAGLPTLLFFRRTRAGGLALGWSFHLALGWNGFYDFSTIALAYYALFLPDSVGESWRRAGERFPALARTPAAAVRAARSPLALPLAACAVLALAAVSPLSERTPEYWQVLANRSGRNAWLALWLAAGVAIAAALLGERRFEPPDGAWRRRPAWLVAPLLVVANGLCPYLGLKTENSFAMFSNLQTEGDRWNSYWLPRAVRIFSFQDELVRVVEAPDPALVRAGRRGVRLVPFELRRFAGEDPRAEVAYEIRGELHRARPVAADARIGEPPHPALAKLLLFRPVQPRDRNRCVH